MRRRRNRSLFRFYLLAVSMTLCAVVVALSAHRGNRGARLSRASPAGGSAVAGHRRQGAWVFAVGPPGSSDRLGSLSVRPLPRGREMEVDHAGQSIRGSDLAAADLGIRHLRRAASPTTMPTGRSAQSSRYFRGCTCRPTPSSSVPSSTARSSIRRRRIARPGRPSRWEPEEHGRRTMLRRTIHVQDRPEEQREGERLTQAAPKIADEKG